MPGLGNYVSIDMSSVKTDATKTIKFLNDTLSKRKSNQKFVVVFLGEEHRNAVDEEVTQAMLTTPPIVDNGHTRVIFERQLDQIYRRGVSIDSQRTEVVNLAANKKTRSKMIAKMIQDAFDEHDVRLVYVPCGSAHAVEIYDNLNKRFMKPFTYISKPSSTD